MCLIFLVHSPKGLDLDNVSLISISEKNFPSLKKELESILDLVAKMDLVDTQSVKPMSHPLDLSQPLRKDEITEKDDREKFQKIAPSTKAGLFMVPKVIEEED